MFRYIMEYYNDKLRKATLDLTASSTQLDLDIQSLPLTSSPDHRIAIISKLKRQHYARRSKIKHDYGSPAPEITTPEDKTFPFIELPQEIQDLIWRFTLPGPRVVPILHKEKYYGLTSPCAPPIALHICRASRDIALKSGYELAFRTSKHAAPIYFNFAIDTAYIDSPGLFGDIVGHGEPRFSSLPSASRIKRLALGLSVTLNPHDSTYWTMPRLAKYSSLETLFIATYLCDEWLCYGEIKQSKIRNVLVPHLGQQAIEWRGAIERAKREHFPQLSVTNVDVLLITNPTLRPWMCQKVLDNWESAMAKALKNTKPEYILDQAQVTAVAKSKIAVFDSIACVCDAAYAEKAYARYDASFSPQWEMQLRDRLRTYSVSYY
jgi:2EXR family